MAIGTGVRFHPNDTIASMAEKMNRLISDFRRSSVTVPGTGKVSTVAAAGGGGGGTTPGPAAQVSFSRTFLTMGA